MHIARPAVLWSRLRSTYWFLPALQAAAAVVLATVLTNLDRWVSLDLTTVGWAYAGGADGARALLSAVAGSIITVVSVTFSVTIVALTVSSQHFGPRLLNNFMRDTVAQSVLGTFIGTFAYCLLVLRTVQGPDDSREAFVPHLAVTGAVALALMSVVALIYYVHHVALSLQVSQLALGVAGDLRRAVERLHAGAALPPGPAPDGGAGAPVHPARARSSGYLQDVDEDALFDAACRHAVTVHLRKAPGAFVLAGAVLAEVRPAPDHPGRLDEVVRRAMVLGADRTSRRDPGFAVQQLVEIALRALSPGVNEPFTAVTCIDRLTDGLAELLRREPPPRHRHDDAGRPRLELLPVGFDVLLAEAFDPVARAGADDPDVLARVLDALTDLGGLARRPVDRAALVRQVGVVLHCHRGEGWHPDWRRRVEDAAAAALRAAA